MKARKKPLLHPSVSIAKDPQVKKPSFRDDGEGTDSFHSIEKDSQFRILFDCMGDAIHVVDKHLRIVLFNEVFRKWNRELGLPSRVVGKHIRHVFPFLPDRVIQEYNEVFRTGKTLNAEESYMIGRAKVHTETRKIPVAQNGHVHRVITIVRNITAQKSKVQHLDSEEKRYQLLFNHANDAIFVHEIDKDGMPGRFTEVNDVACQRFGFSRETLLKMSARDLEDVESTKRIPEIMKKLMREKHVIFEMDQRTNDGKRIASELSAHLFDLEGQPTILTISRDITNRRQVQEDLKETEERYRALFNRSLHAVFINDFKGRFLDANQAGLDLLGYTMADIKKRNFSSLIDKKDIQQAFKVSKEIKRQGRQTRIAQYNLKRKDGSKVFVEMEGVCLNRNGQPWAIQGIARDVTDRKQVEERIRQSEEKYRSLVENLHDGYVAVDMGGSIIEYNPAFRAMLGYEEGEIEDLTHEDITVSKWHKEEARIIKKQVLKRGYSDLYEKEYIRKDGSVFPVELRTYLFRYNKGNPTGMWTFVRNISDRKETEAVLRESEGKFRELAEQSPNMIVILSGTKFVYVNQICEKILGYSKEEFYDPDFSFLSLHPPEFHESIKNLYMRIGQGLDMPPSEVVFVSRAGKRSNVIMTAKMINYRGETAFLGIGTDTTELKKVREALEEEHAFRAVAIKKASEGMCVCYLKGMPPRLVFTDWNDRMKEITGYSMEKINELGVNKTLLRNMSSWQQALAKVSKVQDGAELGTNEWEIIRADGAKRLVTASASILHVADGKTRLMAMINDITEQNLALETLKESEEKYSNLFQHSNDAIFLHDTEGTIIDVNQTAMDLFGYSTVEFLGMRIQTLHPEESFANSKQAFKKIIHDGFVQFEILFRKKNEDVFPAEVSASLYEIDGKKIIQGMVRDITDRKLAEEALRVSEERYRTITENINAGIYRNTPGPKGKFIEANPNVVELFGYDSKEELLGILVTDLYERPEDRKTFNSKMKRDGFVKSEELLLKRKDGTTFWGSVTAVAVFDEDGDLKHYDGVIEDITEKRESQERVRASLREKEVLLKEIHHRVKNNMQVVNSLLGLQSRYITDEAALRMFRESQDRVRSMALIHEKLYGSKDLARIDFGEYIRTLTNTLYRTYSADPEHIVLDIEVGEVFLAIDQAVPCGLIVNELVANALKHGFPRTWDKEGWIHVSLQKQTDNSIELIVEDNGVGLPEGFDVRNTDSLGMRLINILAEDQLGGSIELCSDKATRFCIHFEVTDEKQE